MARYKGTTGPIKPKAGTFNDRQVPAIKPSNTSVAAVNAARKNAVPEPWESLFDISDTYED